jgi:cephalosporin hydroxylase
VPIPQDLERDYLDAYWRSLRWQKTTWLGHPVGRPPADLIAYQELICRVKPDVIVEVGAGTGGRSLFLASVCEMLDHGQVVAVGGKGDRKRPKHSRLTYVPGDAAAPATVAKVRSIAGTDPAGLVILGSRQPRAQMVAQFDAYAPLVTNGSFVVFEDTIVGGNPVWPTFGPGPADAVVDAQMRNPDFVVDESLVALVPSFNPAGYLRRVEGRERTSKPSQQRRTPTSRLISGGRPALTAARRAANVPRKALKRRASDSVDPVARSVAGMDR